MPTHSAPTQRPTRPQLRPLPMLLATGLWLAMPATGVAQNATDVLSQTGVPGSRPYTAAEIRQLQDQAAKAALAQHGPAIAKKAEQEAEARQAQRLKNFQDSIATLTQERDQAKAQLATQLTQGQDRLNKANADLAAAQKALEKTERETDTRQAQRLKNLQDSVTSLTQERDQLRRERDQATTALNKANAALTSARSTVATAPAAPPTPAPAPATPTTVAPPPAPAPAPTPIPDFTRLPSVAGGPVFVALPLGSFEMGSTSGRDNERPPHPVRVSQRIAMGEMEVTTAQYMACASDTSKGKPLCDQPQWNETGNKYNLQTGSDKHYQKLVADNQPIVGVSWHNARQYAEWLSRETGHSYKLPTEAQWEFACRAGGTHTYCGSNDVKAVAWYGANSGGKTHPVGDQGKKNAWGLFDMSGNVWEWVADCYNDKEYQRRKDQGGEWPVHQTSEEQAGCLRVLRGGSWNDNVRSANRDLNFPDYRDYFFGFRLSRTLP